MKAEGGVHGRYNSLGVVTAVQDGNKHYLLCAPCEQYLGEAENYLAILCRSSRAEFAVRGLTILPDCHLEGVNRTLVMRGLLGILFKAHFAPSAPFHTSKLDRGSRDSLQRAILRDEYPVERYGVVGDQVVGVCGRRCEPPGDDVHGAGRLT